ncbi:hypothetical protein HXX76_001313 [Chlamydomonas incerta]|uniref:Uncharacterized protein n=1 Tax=Chlamydomonas incerta TaxID=51695 RepID=A0A835WC37_CHLIN|nr:hypothetical protein HXX76_001313 [Chlamydomonas incerta]|eukprot:KAG2444568.1 hypothetical protein HXX76_001313 [Chlamydomonas incerta]
MAEAAEAPAAAVEVRAQQGPPAGAAVSMRALAAGYLQLGPGAAATSELLRLPAPGPRRQAPQHQNAAVTNSSSAAAALAEAQAEGAAALLAAGPPPQQALLPPQLPHSGEQRARPQPGTVGAWCRLEGGGNAQVPQHAASADVEPPGKRQRTCAPAGPPVLAAHVRGAGDDGGGGGGPLEAGAAQPSTCRQLERGRGEDVVGPQQQRQQLQLQHRHVSRGPSAAAGVPAATGAAGAAAGGTGPTVATAGSGGPQPARQAAAATVAATAGVAVAAQILVPSLAVEEREEAAARPHELATNWKPLLERPRPPRLPDMEQIAAAAAGSQAPANSTAAGVSGGGYHGRGMRPRLPDMEQIAAATAAAAGGQAPAHGTAAGVAGTGGNGRGGGHQQSHQHGYSRPIPPNYRHLFDVEEREEAAASPHDLATKRESQLEGSVPAAAAEVQVRCPPVQSVSALQEQLQQWARQQAGMGAEAPRTFVVDLGGAALSPDPQALEQTALRIPPGVSVVIRNGRLPVPVLAESCRMVLLEKLTVEAELWQAVDGAWQPVERGLVVAAGAETLLVAVACRLVVPPVAASATGGTPGNRLLRSCRTVAGPPLARWGTKYSQNGVVAAEGARVLVKHCSIAGPYSVELQRKWLGDSSPLDCTGVLADGAGSRVVALHTRAECGIEGFKACNEGALEAYGCIAQECSDGFSAWLRGRMQCGHAASAAAAAAAASVAAAAAASVTAAAATAVGVAGSAMCAVISGSAGGAGSSSGGVTGVGGGCRAVSVPMHGFAAYHEGSEMELLDGCSSERCEGAGCLAWKAALRASGFTSVGDRLGFLVTKASGFMQLQAGCIAREPKERGFVAQDRARMEIGPPAEAAAAEAAGAGASNAGSGLEPQLDALADGCSQEGFIAIGGSLVLRPGARLVARGCSGDGFVASKGGLLDAAAASECLAQDCQKDGFYSEDKGSRLVLGAGVCRATGNKGCGVVSKKGGAVVGALADG